jgi:hypothetical protein
MGMYSLLIMVSCRLCEFAYLNLHDEECLDFHKLGSLYLDAGHGFVGRMAALLVRVVHAGPLDGA